MAKRDFGQVASNTLEVLESPLFLLPSMEPVFALHVEGNGTLASPTMKLYKGTKDISVSNLTGSMSVSERSIVLKKIVSLTPGDYVFYVYFTDGGIATARFCRFTVGKEGA